MVLVANMALLQNGYRDATSGARYFGATFSNSANPYVIHANNSKTALARNITAGEGGVSSFAGIPNGYRERVSWRMGQKPGYLVSRSESQGVATAGGTLIEGRPITGTADGTSTADATGQLVVSGSGTSEGTSSATGTLQAALLGTGTAAGSATADATIEAKAWATASITAGATCTGTLMGIGNMSGNIAPATELDAATFSTYLLDQEDVETGLTMRKALRLIAAATAGQVSGASGTTVTIKSAVANDKSRMTVTCDGDGNRSAITYDLDD